MIESWSIGPDGDDVLTVVTASRPDGLAGHGTFDPDRVRMEVVDRRPGTAERDITVKRFPTWGDASHLIDVLDVRPDGDLRYVGLARSDGRRPVVEGSQMLAQSIVAAGRHATDRRPVSAGMLFLRPADAGRPLRFELEEVSAGRTFTGLIVPGAPGRPMLRRRHHPPRHDRVRGHTSRGVAARRAGPLRVPPVRYGGDRA